MRLMFVGRRGGGQGPRAAQVRRHRAEAMHAAGSSDYAADYLEKEAAARLGAAPPAR